MAALFMRVILSISGAWPISIPLLVPTVMFLCKGSKTRGKNESMSNLEEHAELIERKIMEDKFVATWYDLERNVKM